MSGRWWIIISNIIDCLVMFGWDQSYCNGFQALAERDNDTRQDYKFTTRLNLFCVVGKQIIGKINSYKTKIELEMRKLRS